MHLSFGESGTDLCFSLAHTNSDFDQGIGDSFVVTELHDIWSHWDTEFLSHIGHFINLWLGAESRGQSVERLLSVHKSLELASWIVVLNVALILYLLLGSRGISLGNSLVHLGLHLSGLKSGFSDSWKI